MIALALVMPSLAQAAQAQLFVGTPWKIAQVGSHTGFAQGVATLSLDREGGFSAFSGCNGMGGGYTLEAQKLEFKGMVGTLMACDEPKMRDEQILKDALGSGPFTVSEHAGGATLRSAGGLVIELVPVADYPEEE